MGCIISKEVIELHNHLQEFKHLVEYTFIYYENEENITRFMGEEYYVSINQLKTLCKYGYKVKDEIKMGDLIYCQVEKCDRNEKTKYLKNEKRRSTVSAILSLSTWSV